MFPAGVNTIANSIRKLYSFEQLLSIVIKSFLKGLECSTYLISLQKIKKCKELDPSGGMPRQKHKDDQNGQRA